MTGESTDLGITIVTDGDRPAAHSIPGGVVSLSVVGLPSEVEISHVVGQQSLAQHDGRIGHCRVSEGERGERVRG